MTDSTRRVLLVGGAGGLVGRAVLAEFAADWTIRSVHRHPVAEEGRRGVEWVQASIRPGTDWSSLLRGTETIVNLAWYRSGGRRRFVPLADGLIELIGAARAAGIDRFVHLSVPEAPPEMEAALPYLSEKRRVDRALERSGLPYLILRPTLLFGPRDRLLTVMLRLMHRYGTFPMFGDGGYHVSPLASADLARILRHELERPGARNLLLGGPTRYRYRDLTDRMWAALARPPRYTRLSPRSARTAAWLLERIGSQLVFEYEVEWLMSDLLGPSAYPGLHQPLEAVEPFLDAEGLRLRAR